MKTFIFFDLDGTIFNTKLQKVPSETIKLLEELSKHENVFLGLATGRNINKSNVIKDLLPLFTYKIFINGALAYYKNEVIVNKSLNIKDMKLIRKNANEEEVVIGYVASDNEYLSKINDLVIESINNFNIEMPEVVKDVYKIKNIYQMWVFSKNKESVNNIIANSNLQFFSWHSGGADIVRKDVSKGLAIKQLLKDETNYRLIVVGDGQNDLSMFDYGHINIAMGNSGFLELKKKAHYIAPNIDDNELYNFFVKTIFSDKVF